MVDGVVDTWCREVLFICRPSIVVALDGENRDVFPFNRILDVVSDNFRVVRNLLFSVIPDSVGRVITSPQDHIWIDL